MRLARNIFNRLGYFVINRKWMPYGVDHAWDINDFYGKERQVRVIADVGANVGNMSIYYAHQFPAAQIFSFEPVPATYETLKARTSRFKNIHCNQYALGSARSEVCMKLSIESGSNSLLPSNQRHYAGDAGEVSVSVEPFDDFMVDQLIERVDLLKIDTEGYDLEVLKGAARTLEEGRIISVYVEVDFKEGDSQHSSFQEIESFLKHYGFSLTAFYDFTMFTFPGEICFCNALFFNLDALNAIPSDKTGLPVAARSRRL